MEEMARCLIGEFLEKRGLEELKVRSKGNPLKIELAGELRKHTAMSMARIAKELHAGAWWIWRNRKAEVGNRRA